MFLPAIFSLSGPKLTKEERDLFYEAQPFGFILFARNIQTPEQTKNLINTIQECVGRTCPILIDQEGGRVQRLKPPHWPKYPAMQECTEEEKLSDTITSISKDLKALGINTNCAPVLDVLFPETDTSIGDRAFSQDINIVSRLGELTCKIMLEQSVRPVIKHLPGHGRARVDSHEKLPIIDSTADELKRIDIKPFIYCLEQEYKDQLWGMVGHCCYTMIDPEFPASLSKIVISQLIREAIGFNGLLLSDDLSMGALNQYGPVQTRAKLCLDAGCDIALYCAGDLDEMHLITEEIA